MELTRSGLDILGSRECDVGRQREAVRVSKQLWNHDESHSSQRPGSFAQLQD